MEGSCFCVNHPLGVRSFCLVWGSGACSPHGKLWELSFPTFTPLLRASLPLPSPMPAVSKLWLSHQGCCMLLNEWGTGLGPNPCQKFRDTLFSQTGGNFERESLYRMSLTQRNPTRRKGTAHLGFAVMTLEGQRDLQEHRVGLT